MNVEEVLGAFSLVNNPIVLSEEEVKDVQKAIKQLQQENKQLKEQLSVAQTNEETFRLEMKDITKTLGLDENTLFDDVKIYARSLKDNWNKLKEWLNNFHKSSEFEQWEIVKKMQELEQGSDSDENN